MLILEPRPKEESLTIAIAQGQKLFTRILLGAIGVAQSGVLILAPAQYQAKISMAVMVLGGIAILAGHEQKGNALIEERLSKGDLWTPPSDKDHPNEGDAVPLIRAESQSELADIKKAVVAAKKVSDVLSQVPNRW